MEKEDLKEPKTIIGTDRIKFMISYVELARNFQDGGRVADFRLSSSLIVFVCRKLSAEKVGIFKLSYL